MKVAAWTSQTSSTREAVDSPREEILLASKSVGNDLLEVDLLIPSARCGGCISKIEGVLARLDQVVQARVNLSTRRVTVRWRRKADIPPLLTTLADAGYPASLSSLEADPPDPEIRRLVLATAIAGFAMMNILMLSVSVWAGAGADLRHVFHVVSAVLAIPVVIYSGRIFFVSAWSALSRGTTNMDVPITVGILLAFGLSAYDTLTRSPHAYFDAVTSLIFFLLIGRTLDHMMRHKTRSAVLGLTRLMPRGATVRSADGKRIYSRIEDIRPGQIVIVAAGERIPADGVVIAGAADIDSAIVTGESAPLQLAPGGSAVSGMLNLNGQLEIRATQSPQTSFIASMVALMESAEHGRARYRRIADRAAALYAPVVHSLAFVAFIGWLFASGNWHHSLTIAISVLIITCPCALGLAVPMVQVMAARRLFENGIALKDGSALERLAEVDRVIFDKTGTLTEGRLQIASCTLSQDNLKIASALAAHSRHPAAQAIATYIAADPMTEIQDFVEHPGLGVEGRVGDHVFRLGRPDWVHPQCNDTISVKVGEGTLFSKAKCVAGAFEFSDTLRSEAEAAIRAIASQGIPIEILSGDNRRNVSAVANRLGVEEFTHGLTPHEKVQRLEELRAREVRTLMVGDGLNDAPALSAAHVSMAPATAADVGRAAADLVYLNGGLDAVPEAITTAKRAQELVRQNLALAVCYNICVVPIALTGLVTPLIAAIAMSFSSILVVANALRVRPISRRHFRGADSEYRPAGLREAVP